MALRALVFDLWTWQDLRWGVLISERIRTQSAAAVAKRLRLNTEAEAVLTQIRTDLHSRGRGQGEFQSLLDEVESRLRASLVMALPTETPQMVAKRMELLRQVCELRADLMLVGIRQRVELLTSLQQAVARLRDCADPAELAARAPAELQGWMGFSRVLSSQVRQACWIPCIYESLPTLEPAIDGFQDWVSNTTIPLQRGMLEAEVARRRIPVLVPHARDDSRTFAELMERGRVISYVAAPVVFNGLTVGLMHADRANQQRQMTTEDCQAVAMFAEHLGVLHERARLLERIRELSPAIHEQLAEMEYMLDEFWVHELTFTENEEAEFRAARSSSQEAPRRAGDGPLNGAFTRREVDVLELLKTGATNARMAELLVISEGTVKSHLKHIQRKLGATTRSQAVAKYLEITREEPTHAGS